jgi:membrane fusion protein (multidrug efflux system)
MILVVGCKSAPSAPAAAGGAAAPVPVRVTVATPAPLQQVDEAVGTVSVIDSVEIRAETAGLVQSVSFSDGQAVRKGQALVHLRDADAQASLLDARARARLTALQLDRLTPLLGRGDVAQAEVDKAKADDDLARAAVLKAEEALRRATIVAPFDGVVGRRDVAVGQTVDTTRVLTRIEDLAHLAVDVSLPESAVARVAKDQSAVVIVPALGTDGAAAHVSYVAPRVRDDSRTIDVRVVLDKPDARVRPGMTATVRIVTAEVPDALLVPTQAVVPSANGASVWIAGADNTASLRPITTGERTETQVQAVTGLAAGDAVIVEGLARLRPGAAITATASAPAASK